MRTSDMGSREDWNLERLPRAPRATARTFP